VATAASGEDFIYNMARPTTKQFFSPIFFQEENKINLFFFLSL